MNNLNRAAVMRRDFFRLKKSNAGSDDPRVRASAQLRAARAAAIERLELVVPEELPVAEKADEIRELLRTHQVIVVAGETGSGKTTQLPKLCLEAGFGAGAMIGHTQPRRIAARSVAQRIATECGSELGHEVGYAVRFSDRTDDRTVVKIMTDGLLLTEIRRDRFLDAYDAIIVDEAHERSLNVDFLLGYLKRLVAKRKDLRVIVTSATIDVAKFADFFPGAAIVEVGGRTFPVEVRYRDPGEDQSTALIEVLDEIASQPLGPARDVLAFFSGEREIFEAARALRRHFRDEYEVLPLYARLSAADQQRVFATTGSRRRVVLATNVAETSLTVPNIGFVIDPGFARINRYSYRSKLQRLPIEPISQASADQRKGRCGRIAPGVCYRLYAEEDYLAREAYTDPEIRRVNLASVVLQMHALGLGDIGKFPFIDPPDGRAVKDAHRLLDELAAIANGKLTAIGKQMARLPVDPRLARMLIAAASTGCLREVMIIVAGLAVQDPRERPLEKSQAADTAHAEFRDDRSDFVSYVRLWDWIEAERQANTRNRWTNAMRKRFLSVQRIREWRETHRQLKLLTRELGFKENSAEPDYSAIHSAILSGSLSLIALHDERGQYTGARNLKLRIFPGSGVFKKTPKWIVSAEVVETSRVYARCCASIEAGWIERQAEHLVKKSYSDPLWSLKRGEAIAYESVSLYGLRLVEKRAVAFGKIDPDHSRDLFLREGLIRGAVAEPPDFLKANLAKVASIRELEAKGRRRDILAPDEVLYQFYADRIPREVNRVSDLKQWLRGAKPDEHTSLFATDELLSQQLDVGLSEQDFPGELVLDGASYQLKYRFAPGEKDDGVTIVVPTGLLHALGAEPLEWSVPGMLPLVVEHWLRSLPKAKRRAITPIQDKVDEIAARLVDPRVFRNGRFLRALTDLLSDLYRVRVESGEWDRTRVPEHLLFQVVVVDPSGKKIAEGRDLTALKASLGQDEPAAKSARLEGLTRFPDRVIESQQLVKARNAPVMTYPGFRDTGSSVDLVAFTDAKERDAANRRGYPRLAMLELGKVGQYFRKELKKERELGLLFASLGSAEKLNDEILRNVIWYCYFEEGELPQTSSEFTERLTARRGELATVFEQTVDGFKEAMRLRFDIVRECNELSSPAYAPSIENIRQILDALVPADFLERTPFVYLQLLAEYLTGLKTRLSNLAGRVPRDRALMDEIAPLEARLAALSKAELFDEVTYTRLRFYLEELRLRLFAEKQVRQKRAGHPFDGWKVSTKKVSEAIRQEELRVGLA